MRGCLRRSALPVTLHPAATTELPERAWLPSTIPPPARNPRADGYPGAQRGTLAKGTRRGCFAGKPMIDMKIREDVNIPGKNPGSEVLFPCLSRAAVTSRIGHGVTMSRRVRLAN